MNDTEFYATICQKTRKAKEDKYKSIIDKHIDSIIKKISEAAEKGYDSINYYFNESVLLDIDEIISKFKSMPIFNPFSITEITNVKKGVRFGWVINSFHRY